MRGRWRLSLAKISIVIARVWRFARGHELAEEGFDMPRRRDEETATVTEDDCTTSASDGDDGDNESDITHGQRGLRLCMSESYTRVWESAKEQVRDLIELMIGISLLLWLLIQSVDSRALPPPVHNVTPVG